MAKAITVSRQLTRVGQIHARFTRLIPEVFPDPTAFGLHGAGAGSSAGTPSTSNVFYPITVSEPLTFVKVASSTDHSLAIDSLGRLWGWGINTWGQLGLGDQVGRPVPTLINDTHQWIAIGCGYGTSFTIDSAGVLYSCGDNRSGTLGLGSSSTSPYTTLQMVSGGWVDVDAGYYHAAGIATNGYLYTWGFGGYGQLGVGTRSNHYSPVQTAIANCTAVVCGSHQTFCLSNGDVYRCGHNDYGQLGVSPSSDILTIAKLTASVSWQTISSIYLHVLAIDVDGHLWGWGNNYLGSLATGTVGALVLPTQISSDTWLMAKAGYNHSIGINSDRETFAWGGNYHGELGIGITGSYYNAITQVSQVINSAGNPTDMLPAYICSAGNAFSLLGIA